MQVSPQPVDVPLILGGNSERALRRAAAVGDGWFSSGTPSFEDAVRLRDRVVQLREESGADGDFPIYVRVAKPDRSDLDRYEAEGFEHVLVWADQLWPAEGHRDEKQSAFAAAAAELGVRALP
ncbi:MAG: LLM class flavin-dependent oxidoreductase [Ilumatobacteraceae bacterium]